jgi:DNA-binding GntR family transcriptional regulator
LTKKDYVAAAIRNEIAQGHLPPGMRLRQYDVAARLGVSPTPVREAFGVLALEGLVEWGAYRGVTVARDPRERLSLADLYELRGTLEMLALRIGAATSIAPNVIRLLHDAQRDAREANRTGDLTGWRVANYNFHAGLVEIAGSDLLRQLMRVLLHASLFFPARRSMSLHQEHTAILDAIERGDIKTARSLVQTHASMTVEAARREATRATRLKSNGSPRLAKNGAQRSKTGYGFR